MVGNKSEKQALLECFDETGAMIIRCPDCGNAAFVGVGQAFTWEGRPYPIGECAQCLDSSRRLDSAKDLELMMEFRSEHWDEWVKFCIERDYRPCVELRLRC